MPESTVNLHACRACGSVFSTEVVETCPQCDTPADDQLPAPDDQPAAADDERTETTSWDAGSVAILSAFAFTGLILAIVGLSMPNAIVAGAGGMVIVGSLLLGVADAVSSRGHRGSGPT